MEKEQENSYHKINLNCDKPIYRNNHSNYWKYWFFNVEIFTYFKKKWIRS